MMRMRFPFAVLAALALGATAAHAQSAPAAAVAPVPVPARIEDIQVARAGETVSVLVKLSAQPAAATAKANGETLVLEVDGVSLTPFSLNPPAGSLVTRVDSAIGKVTLSGAAFSGATTVIYRNAVLIEAKLADPALKSGSSLMAAAPAPAPVPAKAPEPVKPEPPKPSPPAIAVAPIANPAARCATAAAELAKDAWALQAMGDHALCLIEQGKLDEAKNRLDQLAAITPQDPRIATGRAAIEKSAATTAAAPQAPAKPEAKPAAPELDHEGPISLTPASIAAKPPAHPPADPHTPGH